MMKRMKIIAAVLALFMLALAVYRLRHQNQNGSHDN